MVVMSITFTICIPESLTPSPLGSSLNPSAAMVNNGAITSPSVCSKNHRESTNTIENNHPRSNNRENSVSVAKKKDLSLLLPNEESPAVKNRNPNPTSSSTTLKPTAQNHHRNRKPQRPETLTELDSKGSKRSHPGMAKMRPGDCGWLESEEEFPSIGKTAKPDSPSSPSEAETVTNVEEVSSFPPETAVQQQSQVQRYSSYPHRTGMQVPAMLSPVIAPDFYFPPGTGHLRSPYLPGQNHYPTTVMGRHAGSIWPLAAGIYANSHFGTLQAGIPLSMPFGGPAGNYRSHQFLQSAAASGFYGQPVFHQTYEDNKHVAGGGARSCSNCGRSGHCFQECSDQTFDEITKSGKR